MPGFDHAGTAKLNDGREVPAKQTIVAAAGPKREIDRRGAVVDENGFRPGVRILIQDEIGSARLRYRALFAQSCRDRLAAIGQYVADSQDVEPFV